MTIARLISPKWGRRTLSEVSQDWPTSFSGGDTEALRGLKRLRSAKILAPCPELVIELSCVSTDSWSGVLSPPGKPLMRADPFGGYRVNLVIRRQLFEALVFPCE